MICELSAKVSQWVFGMHKRGSLRPDAAFQASAAQRDSCIEPADGVIDHIDAFAALTLSCLSRRLFGVAGGRPCRAVEMFHRA